MSGKTEEDVIEWITSLKAFMSDAEVELLQQGVRKKQLDGEAFSTYVEELRLVELSADLGKSLTGRTMVRIRKAWKLDCTELKVPELLSEAEIKPSRKLHADFAGAYTGSIAGLIHTSGRDPSLPPRPVCVDGRRCRDRTEDHCKEYAHIFDSDYVQACEHQGQEPEERTLWNLFHWIDVAKTGKLSIDEVKGAVPVLSSVMGGPVSITDESWNALDQDGNGVVSFQEFAGWAGPRSGLPLGVQHLFSGSRSGSFKGDAPACGIVGCTCSAFKEQKAGARRPHVLRYPDASGVNLKLCICGHKHSAHANDSGDYEVPHPSHWHCTGIFEFNDLIPLDDSVLPIFQKLFDQTHLRIWTHDRRKHNCGGMGEKMPKSYTVVAVRRNENSKAWRSYVLRRALHLNWSNASQGVKIYDDVKLTQVWKNGGGIGAEQLETECNEWLLCHGCSEKNAVSICRTDFKMSLAGGSTGTLYGCGTYLAESVTKADEYAKPDEGDICTIMLCRALGGNVHYTDENVPDPEHLVKMCTEGPYDSVLGDREKCRKTYREFVFFDADSIYCEYLVSYKRNY